MENGQTRVAVLGTLAEFHREPIPFDVQALVDLVVDVHPDLLCLDITPGQWERRDFGDLPPEYREALLPLAEQSNIVVVPIGGDHAPGEPEPSGWRGALIEWLRRGLAGIQRGASGPASVNHGWRHDVANLLYHAIARLAGEQAQQRREQHTAHLTEKTLALADRDPGSRILVVVNLQYCHIIRPELRKCPDVNVVSYQEL